MRWVDLCDFAGAILAYSRAFNHFTVSPETQRAGHFRDHGGEYTVRLFKNNPALGTSENHVKSVRVAVMTLTGLLASDKCILFINPV